MQGWKRHCSGVNLNIQLKLTMIIVVVMKMKFVDLIIYFKMAGIAKLDTHLFVETNFH